MKRDSYGMAYGTGDAEERSLAGDAEERSPPFSTK